MGSFGSLLKLAPPSTPKAKRLGLVGLTGAGLAVIWAGLQWAGVTAPQVFVSAVATFGALIAAYIEQK